MDGFSDSVCKMLQYDIDPLGIHIFGRKREVQARIGTPDRIHSLDPRCLQLCVHQLLTPPLPTAPLHTTIRIYTLSRTIF
jgi:hypothetical protein